MFDTASMSDDLRYPIGKFEYAGLMSQDQRRQCIADIEAAPAKLREAVTHLTDAQLDTPYRPQGWSVRQVVHHVPESHMNAYVRFKLALTEDEPMVKPYKEDAWARTGEVRTTPIDISLTLLECLHQRWVGLLRSMSAAEFERKLKHPELGTVTLDRYLAMYAWHGKHHLAHVTGLRKRNGW